MFTTMLDMGNLDTFRTLDVNDLPECERLEALKMVTQLLVLFRQQKADDDVPPVPTTFPGNVLTVLTAIAMQSLPTFDESKDDSVPNDGYARFDRTLMIIDMFRIGLAALAILLELSVSNPVLVIETVGTEWLLRSLIGPGANNCRYTALSCHVLTKWLDSAEIRERAELNLFLEVCANKDFGRLETTLANARAACGYRVLSRSFERVSLIY